MRRYRHEELSIGVRVAGHSRPHPRRPVNFPRRHGHVPSLTRRTPDLLRSPQPVAANPERTRLGSPPVAEDSRTSAIESGADFPGRSWLARQARLGAVTGKPGCGSRRCNNHSPRPVLPSCPIGARPQTYLEKPHVHIDCCEFHRPGQRHSDGDRLDGQRRPADPGAREGRPRRPTWRSATASPSRDRTTAPRPRHDLPRHVDGRFPGQFLEVRSQRHLHQHCGS